MSARLHGTSWVLRGRLLPVSDAALAQDPPTSLAVPPLPFSPARVCRHHLVLTTRHVLYLHAREPMWAPEPLWACAVRDVELAACAGAALRLVAQRPVRRHVLVGGAGWAPAGAAAAGGGSGGGRGRACSPFAFLQVACGSPAGAQAVKMTLAQLKASMPPAWVLAGHCQILLPAEP